MATSQIPTVPGAPGTAIRFESGLKEIDCAPPDPGGLVVIGRPITRPVAVAHSVTWFVSCRAGGDDAAVGAVANDGERGLVGCRAAGSVSSRRFFLVATSHSSTRPSPPAIASVRPSGLKSTPA